MIALLFAAEEFDLDQAHGIDIGIAQADGAGQNAIAIQMMRPMIPMPNPMTVSLGFGSSFPIRAASAS